MPRDADGAAQRSKRLWLVVGVGLIGALGLVDYALTRRGIALPYYYVVPSLLVAWFAGWRAAAGVTVGAAALNLLIDLALSRTIAQPLRVHLASGVVFLLTLAAARGVALWRLMRDFYTRGDAWRRTVRPHRLGEHVVVVPLWKREAYAQDPQARPTDVVLWMDPGRAFGTGSHPTTQMCVAMLEQHVRPGDRVFDLGCGTGILSVAAAKLGAGTVLGVDVAAEAVRAAEQNAALNGVAAQTEFRLGTLADVLAAPAAASLAPDQPTPPSLTVSVSDRPASSLQPPFRLAVANILTPVVVDALQHGLARTITPDGLVILSGIRAEEGASVLAAMEAAGLRVVERREREGWVAVSGRMKDEE
jgi:ribosomal protein L11 methyltransferase